MHSLKFAALLGVVGVLWQFCEVALGRKLVASLQFISATTNFNADYMSAYDINIQPSAPGPAVDVRMQFTRSFREDLMWQFNALRKDSKSIYRNIFTYDFEFCRIFVDEENARTTAQEMNVGKVLNVWLSNVQKYSAVLQCPTSEGHYVVKSLRADKKSIPGFISDGNYRLDIFGYFKDTSPRVYTSNATIFADITKI